MLENFLSISLFKGGLVYTAKFQLGGFLITSLGISLYGIDLNITDFLPVTETILDTTRNHNSLLTSTLSLPRDIFPSLSPLTVTPPTLPMHVNTTFLAGLLNVHTLAFKFIIGIGVLGIIGFNYAIVLVLSDLLSSLTPFVKSCTGRISKPRISTAKRRMSLRESQRRFRARKNANSSSGSGGDGDDGGKDNSNKNTKNSDFYSKIFLIEILLNLLDHLTRATVVLTELLANNRGNLSLNIDFSNIYFDIGSYLNSLQEFESFINDTCPHYFDEFNYLWTSLNLLRSSYISSNNSINNIVTLGYDDLNNAVSHLNAVIVVIEVILDYIYPYHDVIE